MLQVVLLRDLHLLLSEIFWSKSVMKLALSLTSSTSTKFELDCRFSVSLFWISAAYVECSWFVGRMAAGKAGGPLPTSSTCPSSIAEHDLLGDVLCFPSRVSTSGILRRDAELSPVQRYLEWSAVYLYIGRPPSSLTCAS